MESDYLVSYKREIFMIEGTSISDDSFKRLNKIDRGIVPYERTGFSFKDPNNLKRKFLKLVDRGDDNAIKNLVIKVNEHNITWIGIDINSKATSYFIKINNIWKVDINVITNLSYIDIKYDSALLPNIPFSYYLDIGDKIMAAKEYKRINYQNESEIISLTYQLSKL